MCPAPRHMPFVAQELAFFAERIGSQHHDHVTVGRDRLFDLRSEVIATAEGELSAGVHRSEALSLCHPVVPVFDSLAMITRNELLYQTADQTPRCIIVRMPTPPSAGILLARMRHRATQLAHS
jgi:hypothetical protein